MLGIMWQGQSPWREYVGEGAAQLHWRPWHFEDASTVGWPPKGSCRCRVEPAWAVRWELCSVVGRAEEVELHRPRSQVSPRCLIVSIFGLWFLLWFQYNCVLFFFPSWNKKLLNFLFYRHKIGCFEETELLKYLKSKDCGAFKAIFYCYINKQSCGQMRKEKL